MTWHNGRSGTARSSCSERPLTHSLDLGEEQAMAERTCSIDGCEKPSRARGWCEAHYERWRRRGTTDLVGRSSGPRVWNWRGDDAGYSAVHKRIGRWLGLASEHVCTCGSAATEWAYDHDDPDERSQQWYGRTVFYSTNSDHYLPMCIPCHRRFDLEHKGVISDGR